MDVYHFEKHGRMEEFSMDELEMCRWFHMEALKSCHWSKAEYILREYLKERKELLRKAGMEEG